MKPKSTLRHLLLAAVSALVALPNASAIEYWWNQNGTTSGWGAGGTWDGASAVFSITDSDTASAAAATTTTSDILNIGTSTVGFAGGTINLGGSGQSIGTIVTGSANTTADIVIGGQPLLLAASGTITNNSSRGLVIGAVGVGAATRLDLNANGGDITMSGSNNLYTGITYVNSGTVWTNNAASLGTSGTDANRTVVASGARLIFNNSPRTYTERFEIAGAGVGGTSGALVNSGNRTTTLDGQVTLSGNATTYSDSTANAFTFGGGIVLAANALTFNSVNAGSIQTVQTNAISGTNGSVVKTGNGVLNLNVASSYTGGTTLGAGTINIGAAISGSNSAIGSTSGTLTVNGGTLNMAGNNVTVGNLTGSGGVISGTTGTRTLTIGSGDAGGGNFQGQINTGTGGTTALTKTGNGTITFSGINGYSGATLVSGGKLTISSTGTINSTSGVSIGAGEFNYNSSTALSQPVSFSGTGGTLSGSGAISQTVNITAGNTLAIGNSPGTMSFGSNLTVGGTYLYELTGGSTTADLGDVTGNLTLGGILDLVQLGTYTAGNKFTLFAYDGTLSGVFKDFGGATDILDDTNFTDAGGIWTMNYNDINPGLNGGSGSRYVTITAIPEPSAVLLGGLGMLMLLRRRR